MSSIAPPRVRVALAPTLALLLGATSCSSAASSSSGNATPEKQAFSYLTNLIPVEVTLDGATGEAFVDTGNPFILLDPRTFPPTSSLSNGGDVPSVTIGTQTVQNAFVIGSSAGLSSPDPSFPIAGNVGCTGICSFVAAFDYRAATFALGSSAPSPPSGLQADVSFPFSFEGGSVMSGLNVPRSRVVVDVSLEGAKYSMILDTGASSVVVSQAAYAALTADGRTQLMGGMVETTSGTSVSTLTRAASIVVGGAEVDSVIVMHDTSFDNNLAAISTDVGHTIDGSLGGDFLHDFYVTIDYPARTVHLARYADRSFAVDEAEQIGLAYQQQGGQWVVSGTSTAVAAKGVRAGDVVEAVDGVELGGLDLAQAILPLYGAVGATKDVRFGSAAQVAGQTVALVVEEFLPLPPGK